MANVNIDSSEVRALAADMRAIPEKLGRHVVPVVERGANNIAKEVRENFQASTHFSVITPTVGYSMRQTNFGGIGAIEAEIGPGARKGRTGQRRGGSRDDNSHDFRGDASALAHIAVHGTSRGGGGNVRDPIFALEKELPGFEKAMANLAEDILG